MAAKIMFLHALTPVHSGTGHAVAVIDLPIAREKATGWPQIPGSSIKGVLRDALRQGNSEEWIDQAFGKQDATGDLAIGDQRLLCLAVRSFFGTFAYVTSPLALTRFLRDTRAQGAGAPFDPVPTPGASGEEIGVALGANSVLGEAGKVYLEDLDLHVRANPAAEKAAAQLASLLFDEKNEQEGFQQRFAVVPDDVFSFLCETATEVTARIRLQDDTKTVAKGGLWYQEAVPAESIFVGPLLLLRRQAQGLEETLQRLHGTLLQIGGDASIGRGLCRVAVRGGAA